MRVWIHMKGWICFVFCFTANFLFAEDSDSVFINAEAQLSIQLSNLREAKSDADKKKLNYTFKEQMRKMLEMKGSFHYTFTKLKTVGIIDSPDKKLRIVNWNVELNEGVQLYTCFLQHVQDKKETIQLIELTDNSFVLPNKPDIVLDQDNWYGALYYQIIPVERSSKTLYTVLGWDGNTTMSTMKVIDIFSISGKTVKMGAPVFKTPDGTFKRMFYEYAEDAVMSLRYEKEGDRILFDHLSPQSPNLAGIYSYYVPDLSYDAFVWKGNKWQLKQDVIGLNAPEEEKINVYVQTGENGEIEKRTIRNKWQNPSDDKTPVGGNVHVAVTKEEDSDASEELSESEKKQKESEDIKKELDKKVKRGDKRDPTNLESVYGGKKRKKRKKN